MDRRIPLALQSEDPLPACTSPRAWIWEDEGDLGEFLGRPETRGWRRVRNWIQRRERSSLSEETRVAENLPIRVTARRRTMRRERRACRKVSERVGGRRGWREGCRVREERSGRKWLDELAFDSGSLSRRRRRLSDDFDDTAKLKFN